MRITGGVHRSRSLAAPRGNATRPTSDRVREALFGILTSASPLAGVRVLDLYAGTGALSFESLSRGAASATLVESARAAIDAIRANADALRLASAVTVLATTVERSELGGGAPFDLVFADPPYALVATGVAPRAVAAIVATPGVLAEGARLVFEHGKGDMPPSIAGLALIDSRRYGDTVLSFYVVTTTAKDD